MTPTRASCSADPGLAGEQRGKMDEISHPFPTHLCFSKSVAQPGSQLPRVYQMSLTVTWTHVFLFELCFYFWCALENEKGYIKQWFSGFIAEEGAKLKARVDLRTCTR